MIEATNSVLQTSSFVRASAEQVSVAESFAANPDRVQKVAQAPYISPYVDVDVSHDKAVIQFRNPDTGAVVTQIPSKRRLEQESQSETVEASSPPKKASPAPVSSPAPAPEVDVDAAVGGNDTQVSSSSPQVAAYVAAAQGGSAVGGAVSFFA